ncbi:FAD dependent oxidoreductase [Gautieria morchelliformis]|nr:FAD dependent oxidoreductase [Gautieria morchelliformis]
MSTSPAQERRIVIVGGGIIGCTSAYYLTRHPFFPASNHHITLLEASTIAGGASGKAAGLVANWAYPHELTEVSFEEHKKLAVRHAGKERWGWREVTCGQWEGRPVNDSAGGKSRPGNAGLHSHSHSQSPGATGLPDDLDWVDQALTDAYASMAGPGATAQVHPYEFTTSMLALAREVAGERLEIIEGAKVVSIERANASATKERGSSDRGKSDRVVGVTYTPTTGSHTVHIPADSILLAAGPWSPTLMPSLPITATRSHSIVIEPTRPLSPHVLFTTIHSADAGEGSPEIYARPHNRAYACSPGDDTPLPPLASLVEVSPSSILALRQEVGSISTPLRDGRVETEQACYLPLGGPIVGAVDELQGLIVAAGHTCWGICNAPGTAKAVAELMMEGTLGKEWKLDKLRPSGFLNK